MPPEGVPNAAVLLCLHSQLEKDEKSKRRAQLKASGAVLSVLVGLRCCAHRCRAPSFEVTRCAIQTAFRTTTCPSLQEEMQRGYFDDFRDFRDSKGKVFLAPEKLIAAGSVSGDGGLGAAVAAWHGTRRTGC